MMFCFQENLAKFRETEMGQATNNAESMWQSLSAEDKKSSIATKGIVRFVTTAVSHFLMFYSILIWLSRAYILLRHF